MARLGHHLLIFWRVLQLALCMQDALEAAAAEKKENMARGMRACRASRLSVGPALPWLGEAPPGWLPEEPPAEQLNLMLMPVDAAGAPH